MESIYPIHVNILVVDDTLDSLRLLSNILAEEGFQVRPVSNGRKALSTARAKPPDLVLLNIMMPDLDGYAVCERLKAEERMRNVPVIFISALNEPLDKVKAFTAGGVAYVTKPFHEAEVLARVKTHLGVSTMHRQLLCQNDRLISEIAERKRTEQELRTLSRAVEQSANAVMVTNRQGIIEFVNPAFSSSTGYAPEEALGKSPNILKSGKHSAEIYQNLWDTIRHGNIWKGELQNQKKSGQFYWDSVTISPVKDGAGDITHYVTVQEDITVRKQAEIDRAKQTRELGILNNLGTLLQICDSERDTYDVFTRICKQLFSTDSGVLALIDDTQNSIQPVASWGPLSLPLPQIEATGDDPDVRRIMSFDDMAGPRNCACPYLHQAPDALLGCFCLPLVTDRETVGRVSVFISQFASEPTPEKMRRLQEQKRQTMHQVVEHYALALANLRLRERLRQESIIDPLTSLYNRRYMEESLTREIDRTQRQKTSTAVLMLDVDHFKSFNDTYGHEAADLVLQALGALLQRNIRGGDVACRYGGEEFLLILPDTQLHVAAQRAEELLKQVRMLRLSHQDASFQITTYIGVAVLPEHASRVETLIRAADDALYTAKRNGRDQAVIATVQEENAIDFLPEVSE